VQAAEDAWNTRHDAIIAFLAQKWERELDYVLRIASGPHPGRT
jgi:nuclear transport factor 2 (NTF2) superfamily protein